jgi:hypothetical protein
MCHRTTLLSSRWLTKSRWPVRLVENSWIVLKLLEGLAAALAIAERPARVHGTLLRRLWSAARSTAAGEDVLGVDERRLSACAGGGQTPDQIVLNCSNGWRQLSQ